MVGRRGRKKHRRISAILVALVCCFLIGVWIGGKSDGTGQNTAGDAQTGAAAVSQGAQTDAGGAPHEQDEAEADSQDALADAGATDEALQTDGNASSGQGQNPGFPDGAVFTPAEIPAYSGADTVELNDGIPFFTEEDLAFEGESYSALDALGRCGPCMARVGPETLPTEPRGQIGEVRPSGWQIAKYAGIDGNYLYNRSHLIGFQLTGENANPRNLITGTRHMNAEVMEPIETKVGNYVRNTDRHVLYRATPVFEGDDLVARGVLLEAWSLEDERIRINTFCYNVQPGITIDYATGESTGPAPGADAAPDGQGTAADAESGQGTASNAGSSGGQSAATRGIPGVGAEKEIGDDVTYVGNANSMKFHTKDCSSVQDMADRNVVLFRGERQEVIDAGYKPCGRCHP